MNCAQQVSEIAQPTLTNMLKYTGGGNAPQHVCGALYAAQLANPGKKAEMEKLFLDKFNGVECSELFEFHKCSDLVQYGIELSKI